ncbi:MAG TPA: glycerol-3-phosphate dehydrogenase C-terminal domain-containing protein, partial [Vulgatibacter sp.]|nr:glycerol-3-phosphate dehydrogenase C-terminal domain-containing protein [Vulgatibacter sp.]
LCQAADGREVFVMPHGQTSVIGTTDDDFYGDPDDIRIHEDEVRYLWEAIERSIPSLGFARILRAWAGIRPTAWDWGKPEDDLSREHVIYDHRLQGAPGLLSMVGGKLASYRIMAEEAVDVIEDRLGVPRRPCRTHLEPLPGGESYPDVAALAREYRIPETTVARIAYRHGANAVAICELARKEPRLRAPVCRCEQVIAAELVWSLRNEEAEGISELRRRTRLGMGPCQGADCAAAAAALVARERGGGARRAQAETLVMLQERWKGNRPVLGRWGLAQEELSRGIHLASGGLANAPAARGGVPAVSPGGKGGK